MFDLVVPKELPTSIPSFGQESRLALSSDIQFGGMDEIPLLPPPDRVEVTRQSSVHSMVSRESTGGALPREVVDFVKKHFVDPQRDRIERSPDHPEAVVSAAIMMLAVGENEDALALLTQHSNSRNYWLQHYLAISLSRVGKADEAKRIFERLIAEHPEDPRPVHALGRMLIQAKAYEEAWKVLEGAVRSDDAPALLFNDCANVALQRGDSRTAIRLLRKALSRDDRCTLAMNNLGLAYLLIGDIDKAERYFRQAIECDPRCIPAVHNLAETYMNTQRFEEAALLLEQHLRTFSGDPQASERLAWVHFSLGRPKLAVQVLEETIRKLGGLTPPLLNNLGIFYDATGSNERAASCFERAIALQPGNQLLRSNYASSLARRKRWSEVLRALSVEASESDAPSLLLITQALANSGRAEEAAAVLERNFEQHKDDPRIAQFLGYLLSSGLDEPERAIPVLQRSLELHPDAAGLVSNLGYAFLKAGKREEAKAVLEPWMERAEASNEDPFICIVATWGLLRIREGAYEEGIAYYRAAKSRAQGRLRQRVEQKILVEEARYLIKKGRSREARTKLKNSLRVGADREFTGEAQALLKGGSVYN